MKIVITNIMFAIFSAKLMAQPSFGTSFMLAGQKIFPDIKKTNLYYYTPFDYKLMTDANGKPIFTLTQMRYTGTISTGDAGVAKYNNLLQFRVGIDLDQQKKMSDVKTMLRQSHPGAELNMMPVKKFSSLLVFASSSTVETNDSLHAVKTNFTEATDEKASINNSYWTERTVTLRLSDADAQLVESALKNHQSVMSFSYAFFTVFAEKSTISTTVYGDKDFRHALEGIFLGDINNEKDSARHLSLIKADAISLSVDVTRWPTLIQKTDINERLPAKYPLFDVYCYDFNQELRADLFEKKIEIKATSVNGADVTANYTFREANPEVYAKSIRFPFAIQFDRPFYYRVTEINHDGDAVTTEWKQKAEWSELLDISSPPDKIVLKPKEQIEQ